MAGCRRPTRATPSTSTRVTGSRARFSVRPSTSSAAIGTCCARAVSPSARNTLPDMARWIAPLAVGLCLAFASGASAAAATWQSVQAAPGVVDVAGPRTDDTLVAAVGGGVELFDGRGLIPFTHPTGAGAYAPSAAESYIAVTPDVRLPKSGCSFHRNDVFALGDNPDRVVRITRRGNATDFASLPSPFLSGIAFDRVGTFGHRLLVAGTANGATTLYAIDCHRRVKVLTRQGPLVEGGMEVAPRGFPRFGGRLI